MGARDANEEHRAATPLELLFDLCFVVAVSRAASLLHHAESHGSAGRAVVSYVLVFFAILFSYISPVVNFVNAWRGSHQVDADLASRIVWLDRFVQNPDRRVRNPNLLWSHEQLWLIDHGASLGFHHDWRRVTEDAPRARGWPLDDHVLQSRATRLALVDEECAGRLDRDTLQSALNAVPEEFLPSAGVEGGRRRRAAYVAFLWKRLKSPRPFI